MNAKKLLVVVLVLLVCASFVFAACQPDVLDEEPPICTLTYANWNLDTEETNNLERRMLKAFEEKYNVKIEIAETGTGNAYDDSIVGLIARNKTPDVFMLSNMHFGLKDDYLLDISQYAEADSDWSDIPGSIESAVHYGSGIYAVPFAMHMMGYFVNTTLLGSKNIKELEVSPTLEDFTSVVTTLATYKNQKDGIIGLSHESTIFEWYPAYADENLGWFSWDGEKYNLDSEAFIDGMALTKEMRSKGLTYDSLTEEERATGFEGIDSYGTLWNQGRLGIRWGYSYEIPDMLKNSNGAFDISFIGVPGGRTPIVGDYLGISKTSANPEWAYKLAKWMSFDPEGIAKRMELDTESNEYSSLPLTTDADTVEAYFDKYVSVNNLQDVFETLDNGIVESVKVVPGYTASRWKARTGVSIEIAGETVANVELGVLLDNCWNGSLTYRDYAKQVNDLANAQYANTIAKYPDYQ